MITYAAENCDYGGEFKSIQAVDANTVVLTLCFPATRRCRRKLPSPPSLSSRKNSCKRLVVAVRTDQTTPSAPVPGSSTTGIWATKSSSRAMTITGAIKPKQSQLIFRWSTEAAARLNELQAGTVDGIDNVGPNDFDAVKSNPDLNLIPVEGLNILVHRHQQHLQAARRRAHAPGDRLRHRQAAHRRQLLSARLDGRRSVHADLRFSATHGSHPFPYDPDKAKQLLAEAAADDGFTLPLSTLADGTPLMLSYRDVVRPLSAAAGRDRRRHPDSSSPLSASTYQLDVQESGHIPRQRQRR